MMKSNSPIWHPFTQHAVQPDATLIAIELGILIEVPAPIRLVLLGQISVTIPTKTEPRRP